MSFTWHSVLSIYEVLTYLCVYKCIYTHSLPGGGGVYGLNLGNASTLLPFPPEPLSTAYSHPVWGSLDTFTVFWKLVNNIFWNAFKWLLLSILDLGDNISLGQSILLLDLQALALMWFIEAVWIFHPVTFPVDVFLNIAVLYPVRDVQSSYKVQCIKPIL